MSTAFDLAADMIDPPDDDWDPLPHQIPPDGDWFCWLLLGGRGCGKTAASARYLHDHLMGPPCLPNVPGGHWASIIAPTLGDGVTSVVNGPSGLRAHCPEAKIRQTAGGTVVRYPTGAEVKLFGAHTPEDVERLRSGGNRCFVLAEELAAWRYLDECWQHMRYGLRIGPKPRVVVSTTPKSRRMIKTIAKDERTVITHATTADNPHLDEGVKKALYEDYEGTRLGRQELLGLILEDIEGALWTPEMIETPRIAIASMPDSFDRVVVGVDPAITKEGDETGIIVVGMLGPNQWWAADRNLADRSHGFILGDYTIRGTPSDWAKEALKAYHDWEANQIIAEMNNGGEMVSHTIRSYDSAVPIRLVHASRGKAKRAEPVSTLYEQRRVHHVGTFLELEEQMCTWDASDPDTSWSPDRMDAMVWGVSAVMVNRTQMNQTQASDFRLRGRR